MNLKFKVIQSFPDANRLEIRPLDCGLNGVALFSMSRRELERSKAGDTIEFASLPQPRYPTAPGPQPEPSPRATVLIRPGDLDGFDVSRVERRFAEIFVMLHNCVHAVFEFRGRKLRCCVHGPAADAEPNTYLLWKGTLPEILA